MKEAIEILYFLLVFIIQKIAVIISNKMVKLAKDSKSLTKSF